MLNALSMYHIPLSQDADVSYAASEIYVNLIFMFLYAKIAILRYVGNVHIL